MVPRLMGMESEYALAGYTPAGGALPIDGLLGLLQDTARERLPHLLGMRDGGLFLANGSRFYIDAGGHPEMCSPECADPWELTRYCLANERTLAGLLDGMRPHLPPDSEAALYKCNVDYGGTNATWGCHESYLHRMDPATLHRQLIPHLVSRIVYSGAGGFDPMSPGLSFLLSPRAAHIVRATSDQSTGDRGIIHTKDEPLGSRPYHRLHLICGESLCSETSIWLKFGVTALIVGMIEAGLAPGRDVELVDPLGALRAFATDPTCRATVPTTDGRRVSALDVQGTYLAYARANLAADFMPGWAEKVCIAWREMLDRLDGAPAAVATTLDWPIKYALYTAHLHRRGTSWEAMLCWSMVIHEIFRGARQGGVSERPVTLERLIGPRGPMRLTAAGLAPLLREHGEGWDRLPHFQKVRRELFELDTRFGQIGSAGLFTRTDRAGLLSHKVEGVEPIEPATRVPPTEGRARLRGEWIRRLAGVSSRARADWESVIDYDHHRVLDLGDPFATEEKWVDAPEYERNLLGLFDLGFEEDVLRIRRETLRRRLAGERDL